jgi:hypothetical protein
MWGLSLKENKNRQSAAKSSNLTIYSFQSMLGNFFFLIVEIWINVCICVYTLHFQVWINNPNDQNPKKNKNKNALYKTTWLSK